MNNDLDVLERRFASHELADVQDPWLKGSGRLDFSASSWGTAC